MQLFWGNLAAFLEGRPIQARPPGITSRLIRWCVRNPLNAVLAISTAMALVAAAVVATTAAREQGQMLQMTRLAAERERGLRHRAEAAEQAATHREQQESRLRQQYQTLLLKIVGILDDTRLAGTAQSSQNPGASGPAGASFAPQLLAAVIPLIEQSGYPPSWSELEVTARFLALKQFQQGSADVSVLIDKVDKFLRLHETSPEDHEAFVSFVSTRQHFFDMSIDFHVNLQNFFRDWLRLAAQFRLQANACVAESPRILRLLNARAKAARHARDLWVPHEHLRTEHRQTAGVLLQALIDELRQPIPRTSGAQSDEQGLIRMIEEDLERLRDDTAAN
ncbi:MAG: hypothetical protein ACKO2P_02330 [Planctomycetota bacterium]